MKHLIKTSFLFWLSCFFTACGSAEDMPEAMSGDRLSEVVSFAFPAQDYERVLETFEELEEDVRAQMVSQIEEAEVASAEEDLELTLPVSHWHELVLEYQRWLVRESNETDHRNANLAKFIAKLKMQLEQRQYPFEENPIMQQWKADFMQLYADREYATNDVYLHVLDEKGELIEGVELLISWSYPEFLTWGNRRETKEVEVDGTYPSSPCGLRRTTSQDKVAGITS